MGKYKQYEYTFRDSLEDRKIQAADFNAEQPFVHSRFENVAGIGNLFANPRDKNGLSTREQVLRSLTEVSEYLHRKVKLFLGSESLESFTRRLFNNVDENNNIVFSRRECMRRVLNDPDIVDFIYKKFYYIEENSDFKRELGETSIANAILEKRIKKGIQKLLTSKEFVSNTIDTMTSNLSSEEKKTKKVSAEELKNILMSLFNEKVWTEAAEQVLKKFMENKTKRNQYLLDGPTTKDLLAKIYRQIKINRNVKQITPDLNSLMTLIKEKKFPQEKAKMINYKGEITPYFLDNDDIDYLSRFRRAIKRYFGDNIESMFRSKNEWYKVLSEFMLTTAINIDIDTNNFMFNFGDIADMNVFTKGTEVDEENLNSYEKARQKFDLELDRLVNTIPDTKKHAIQSNNRENRSLKYHPDKTLKWGEDMMVNTRIKESFKKSRAIQTFRGANKFSISDSVIYNDNTGEFARVQTKNYQTAYQKFLNLEDKTKGGGMTVGLLSRGAMPFKDFRKMMNDSGQSMLKQKDYGRMEYLAANLAYFSHYRNTVKFKGRHKTEGYGKKVDTSALRATLSELIGLEVKNLIGINLPTKMELKNSVASANLFYLINNEYLLPTYQIIDELIKLYSSKNKEVDKASRSTHTGATIDVSKINGVLDEYKIYKIYDEEHSWKYHNVWTGILREKQRTGNRDEVAREIGAKLIGQVKVSNLTLNFDFREMANQAYSLTMR